MSSSSSTSEYPPTPITELTPELIDALQKRTQAVLTYLVKTNSISTYFKQSDVLSSFRSALNISEDPQLDAALSDPVSLVGTYADNVRLSVYQDYHPFVSRLFEVPCRASEVENLMAPGIPYFIAHSSGTSNGATKHFPKYRHPEHMSTSTAQTMAASNPVSKHGGKNCIAFSLGHRQVVQPLDDDGNILRRIPVCLMSTGTVRMHNEMVVENDEIYQSIRIPNNSSPLAVSYIPNYKSFLFMHALFALQEPNMELINTMFSTIFRDFCRVIDEQWDTLVQCIENGNVPELEATGPFIENLRRFFGGPNPERAKNLRAIGKVTDEPGWLAKIWPGLRAIVAISSGPFATVVPECRHFIGPDVIMQTLGINCSEAFLALAYDSRDPSLYKVVGSDEIIEFLNINEPEDAKSLTQTWNVKVGEKYEVILTTRDGFWRYRLNDVVQVVGFDPTDGQPIVHYLERRNVHIRLANEITTEKQIQGAIASVSDSLGCVSELCVAPDYRQTIPRYAFFLELQNNPESDAHLAPSKMHTYLQTHNQNYLKDSQAGKLGVPSVHIMRRGTFREYREWKVLATNTASGQIKVPLVVWDEETRQWLNKRVIREL